MEMNAYGGLLTQLVETLNRALGQINYVFDF